MRIFKIFFGITLITICFNGFTQYKKNAVVFEIAGKAASPLSVYYQRYFSERFNIGAGIGMPYEFSIHKHEDYYRYRIKFYAPIYFGYSFGRKKSQLSSGLGISFNFSKDNQKLDKLDPMPFISLGYEFKGEKYIFDVPVYLIRILPEVYDAPSHYLIMPYIGFRIGRLF